MWSSLPLFNVIYIIELFVRHWGRGPWSFFQWPQIPGGAKGEGKFLLEAFLVWQETLGLGAFLGHFPFFSRDSIWGRKERAVGKLVLSLKIRKGGYPKGFGLSSQLGPFLTFWRKPRGQFLILPIISFWVPTRAGRGTPRWFLGLRGFLGKGRDLQFLFFSQNLLGVFPWGLFGPAQGETGDLRLPLGCTPRVLWGLYPYNFFPISTPGVLGGGPGIFPGGFPQLGPF